MIRTRKIFGLGFFGTIVGLACAIAACSTSSSGSSGGTDCTNPARCPNDPAVSQNAIDACNKYSADPCASKYAAITSCINTNIKCTSAGKLDSATTNAACQSETDAWNVCETSLMDAGLDAGPTITDAATGG